MTGSLLLKIARRLFDEKTVDRLIGPVIADLQREASEAGLHRVRRLLIEARGYGAFCLAVAGAAVSTLRTSNAFAVNAPVLVHVAPLCAIGAVLVVLMWQMLNWGMVVACVSGTLLAVLIRRWNDRHPTRLAMPRTGEDDSAPRINLAAIPVAANIGGLLFMIGSTAVLAAGLPVVRAFLAAAVIPGMGVACGLLAWHSARPTSRLPNDYLGSLTPGIR